MPGSHPNCGWSGTSWHADEDYGRRVAEGAGIDLEKAKALPPLPGRAAPGKRLQAETYTDGSQAHRVAAE